MPPARPAIPAHAQSSVRHSGEPLLVVRYEIPVQAWWFLYTLAMRGLGRI